MIITWDNLDELYKPNTEVKRGSILNIKIVCYEDVGELNNEIIRSLFNGWTYPSNGKYIKPFKLISYTNDDNSSFTALIKVIKKDKETDELKLFCRDLLDYLNLDHVHVSRIEITL